MNAIEESAKQLDYEPHIDKIDNLFISCPAKDKDLTPSKFIQTIGSRSEKLFRKEF